MRIKSVLPVLALLALTEFSFAGSPSMASSGFSSRNPLIHAASFREDWFRYGAPETILNTMSTWFYVSEKYKNGLSPDCYVSTNGSYDNSASRNIGANTPLSGQPVSPEPNPSFLSWYSTCLQSYLNTEYYGTVLGFDKANEGDVQQRLSTVYTAAYSKGRRSWFELTTEEKTEAARQMIFLIIGPDEVVRELGISESSEKLAKEVVAKTDDFDARRINPLRKASSPPLWIVDGIQIMKYQIALRDLLRY